MILFLKEINESLNINLNLDSSSDSTKAEPRIIYSTIMLEHRLEIKEVKLEYGPYPFVRFVVVPGISADAA